MRPVRAPWGGRVACAVAVVAICAVFPLFVSDAVGYVPLGCCLFAMAFSAAHLVLAPRILDCSQAARCLKCVRGEADDLSVTLGNRSPLVLFRVDATFSVSLEGEEPRYIRARSALAPHEERAFALDVSFDHVGIYDVGLEAVEVFDPMGLFSRVVRVGERCSVRVVPRVYLLERLAGSDLATSDETRGASSVASDDRDYAAVRDYQLGDPMKTVHWKLSARSDGRLYTRLFEAPTNPGTIVLLDFCSDEPSQQVRAGLYDTMLEAAFSLMDFGRRTGVDMSLAFFDRAGVLRVQRGGLREDLDVLIDVMPRLGASLDPQLPSRLLDRATCDPDCPANVVFCAAGLSDAAVDALTLRSRAGYSLRVVLAIPAGMRRGRRAGHLAGVDRLAAARIPVTVLEDGSDVMGGVQR